MWRQLPPNHRRRIESRLKKEESSRETNVNKPARIIDTGQPVSGLYFLTTLKALNISIVIPT